MKYKVYKKRPKNDAEMWDESWDDRSYDEALLQLFGNPLREYLDKFISENSRILEAGCGMGQWVRYYQQAGKAIEGVDIAKRALMKSKTHWKGLNVKYGNVVKLPYEKETFDLYLSFGVVEHFPKGPGPALREAYRVLKPGGKMFITIPYMNKFRYLRNLLGSTPKKKAGEAFYQYVNSRSEISREIRKTGFIIRSRKPFDFVSGVKRDMPWLWKMMTPKAVQKTASKKITMPKKANKTSWYRWLVLKLFYNFDAHILVTVAEKPKSVNHNT